MIIKNIESKIKLALIVSVLSIVGSTVIVALGLTYTYNLQQQERKSIYVLNENIPILAQQTDIYENIAVEAKSHVQLFHQMFFTLAPDDDFIKNSIHKAMYLCDSSAVFQYNTLKEMGFYNDIIAGSATMIMKTDSIQFDKETMSFKYWGVQRIERKSSILKRQLITIGKLTRIMRSDNNPHGLLITNWKTVLNKDLSYKKKRNF